MKSSSASVVGAITRAGYEQLERAVDEAGFYDAAGAVTAADYRP